MNSEYGRLSSEELKARARQSMQRAAEVKPCVTVTEPNWKGMLDTQKAQIELLSRLMSATETLTTKEELTEYMNEQLNISFDEDKASALVLYLSQKGTTVETELEKALDTLYSKTVPAGVRDFIDMKSGTVSSAVPKPKKPRSPKAEHTEVSEVSTDE